MTRPSALLPATRPDDCECSGMPETPGTLPCFACYRRGFKLPDPNA